MNQDIVAVVAGLIVGSLISQVSYWIGYHRGRSERR
jgi:hypothetical protein